MLESARAKGHIDEEIHPVDIGVGYKSVSAIRVNYANGNTNIIGYILKVLFGYASPVVI
jgi:hypothetical protein